MSLLVTLILRWWDEFRPAIFTGKYHIDIIVFMLLCYAVLWCLYRLVFIGPTYHHIPWLKETEDGDDVSLKDFVCELCGRKLILEIGVCRFCKARNNLYRKRRSRFERGVFCGRNYLIVRKSELQLRRLDGSSSQNARLPWPCNAKMQIAYILGRYRI